MTVKCGKFYYSVLIRFFDCLKEKEYYHKGNALKKDYHPICDRLIDEKKIKCNFRVFPCNDNDFTFKIKDIIDVFELTPEEKKLFLYFLLKIKYK